MIKIYALSKKDYEGYETVCISENVNKIRTSICEEFNLDEDYQLEIWKSGEMIDRVSGSDVLRKIAAEMKK